jgi:hypothetical protein
MHKERKAVDSSTNGIQSPVNGDNEIVDSNGHHSVNGNLHVKSEESSGE